MNTRKIGADGEQMAADFLKKNGFEILERNVFLGKRGEIDIVAKELSSNTLVFVEVKYNRVKKGAFGSPEFRCDRRKMLQIYELVRLYMYRKKLSGIPIRIDVIAIDNEGIRHYKNCLM
ncbi:MAG: YraN family protein [Chitinispirillales bacterium]|jgi:putative endonuclease|nr:YraN family protein [Chitinispirillales bacterium]